LVAGELVRQSGQAEKPSRRRRGGRWVRPRRSPGITAGNPFFLEISRAIVGELFLTV
jgi:hypothetical protein